MPHYSTVMKHLLDVVPRHEFERIVHEHGGDRGVRKFSCFQQLVVMLFAQLRGLDSLRDIETSFAAHRARWYHLGLRTVKRSTLAEANYARPWQMYESLYYKIYERCRSFDPKHRFKIPNPVFCRDASVIELCLSLFPWSNYQNTKGAVKLHCQLDYAGYLPMRIVVTSARRHELKVMQEQRFALEPDSILLMDRGFTDYGWYQHLTGQGVWFITRAKKGMVYSVAGQQDLPENSSLLADELIYFTIKEAKRRHPGPLRLITTLEPKTLRPVQILTNNFDLEAATIAELYQARWAIENFFKWIKQHLKIKSFLGTSENAVLTQIWVAMCAYLLLCYIKFQSRCKHSLLELSRIIRETLLFPYCLIDLFRAGADELPRTRSPDPQLELFT